MGAHNEIGQQEDYLDILQEQPGQENIDFLGDNAGGADNNAKIVVPYNHALAAEEGSMRQGIQGLQIEGAFQLHGSSDQQVLMLKFNNNTGHELTDLMLKFQANSYSLQPSSMNLSIPSLPSNGSDVEVKVDLNMNGSANGQPPECPIRIKVALNTQMDLFVFEIPCSFTIFLRKFSKSVNEESFKSFVTNERAIKTKDSIEVEDTNFYINEIESFISKLDRNNIGMVFRQSRPGGEMLNCMTETVDGLPIAIQVYFAANSDQILINYVVVDEALVPLVVQALKFIINL